MNVNGLVWVIILKSDVVGAIADQGSDVRRGDSPRMVDDPMGEVIIIKLFRRVKSRNNIFDSTTSSF
jgi:hypothetical protein